jgi:hypothetical protein
MDEGRQIPAAYFAAQFGDSLRPFAYWDDGLGGEHFPGTNLALV